MTAMTAFFYVRYSLHRKPVFFCSLIIIFGKNLEQFFLILNT